jgi:uncharacterized membrane protein
MTEQNTKEVKRFINAFFKVCYCFAIADGLLFLFSWLIDFIFSVQTYEHLSTNTTGYVIQVITSLFGLTWIIRDGEFIDDIKSSHWTQQDKYKNRKF